MVKLCFTPTYASWANPIEAHFGPLRQFTLANSHHRSHPAQTRALHRYLRWRNANARHPDVLQRAYRLVGFRLRRLHCGGGRLGEGAGSGHRRDRELLAAALGPQGAGPVCRSARRSRLARPSAIGRR